MEIVDNVKQKLNLEDQKFVDRFIAGKLRTSSKSANVNRSVIYGFLNFVSKPSLESITLEDAEDYLLALDKRLVHHYNPTTKQQELKSMRLSNKINYMAFLRGFFNSFLDHIIRKNPYYRNPIPSLKRFQFTPEITPSHEEIQAKVNASHFIPEQQLVILQKLSTHAHSRYVKCQRSYLMIGVLMSVCGMRISECVTIKISDVNIHERFLITGKENGSRKNNRDGTKPLYFCFPDEVAYLLSDYIHDVKHIYPNSDWLFPGIRGYNKTELGHVAETSIRKQMKALGVVDNGKTHVFRKTMEYLQADKNDVPLHFVEMLSNHKITSLVMRHYANAPIEVRREKYDKYFPPQFQPILQWIKTLF